MARLFGDIKCLPQSAHVFSAFFWAAIEAARLRLTAAVTTFACDALLVPIGCTVTTNGEGMVAELRGAGSVVVRSDVAAGVTRPVGDGEVGEVDDATAEACEVAFGEEQAVERLAASRDA